MRICFNQKIIAKEAGARAWPFDHVHPAKLESLGNIKIAHAQYDKNTPDQNRQYEG